MIDTLRDQKRSIQSTEKVSNLYGESVSQLLGGENLCHGKIHLGFASELQELFVRAGVTKEVSNEFFWLKGRIFKARSTNPLVKNLLGRLAALERSDEALVSLLHGQGCHSGCAYHSAGGIGL